MHVGRGQGDLFEFEVSMFYNELQVTQAIQGDPVPQNKKI